VVAVGEELVLDVNLQHLKFHGTHLFDGGFDGIDFPVLDFEGQVQRALLIIGKLGVPQQVHEVALQGGNVAFLGMLVGQHFEPPVNAR
jgi:hypothetical protein